MGPFISVIKDWLQGVIFEWIAECGEDDPPNFRMRQRIRNPGPRKLIRMGRAYRRKKGWSRKEWLINRDDVFTGLRRDVADLPDDDCDTLAAEALDDGAAEAE